MNKVVRRPVPARNPGLRIAVGALPLLMALASAAQAKTDVTLYGTVDLGLTNQRYTGEPATAFDANSSFGLTSGGQTESHFGLRGTEDLGRGVRVAFVLENGFDAGNGSLQEEGRLFGREAWLGLHSKSAGKIGFGRQYNFADAYFSPLTPFGPGEFTSASMGLSFGSANAERLSNMVRFETPEYAGIRAGLGYSFAAQAVSAYAQNGRIVAANPRSERYNFNTSENLRALTAGLAYDGGSHYLTATYDAFYPDVSVAGNYPTASAWATGAMAEMAGVQLSAAYGQARNGWMNQRPLLGEDRLFDANTTNVVFDPNVAVNSYMFGVTVPVNHGSRVFGLLQAAQPTASMRQNARYAIAMQSMISLGYTHAFSKRTNLYAYAGYAKNYSLVDGLASSVAGAGVRHQF
ncbi:MAG: porin [Burkholderiaceae bacterium]|nr:porin [Burkholderiaceae bacterium]